MVCVSPRSAPCTVTETIAPVSSSTACSALCARCVRPSFILVIRASASCGCFQTRFDPLPVRLRSSLARSSVAASQSGGFCQLHQKLFIPLLAVPAHDAAQRCIRFQRSGIDADRLAPQQAARPDPLQYPVKDCFVGSHIDQSSGSGDRGVIRRRTRSLSIPETLAVPENRWLSRLFLVPIRSLRNTPPPAAESTLPEPGSVAPSCLHRTSHTVPPRSRQSRVR